MIELDVAMHKGISDAWEVSSQAIEIMTSDGRQIRITARRDMRRESPPFYDAEYEERGTVDVVEGIIEVHGGEYDLGEGRWFPVWLRAGYPSAYGSTIEECLRAALSWVSQAATKT